MDNPSNTLCHYTTAEAAFQHILPSGKLRMSPYSRMRDPLENRSLTFGAAGWGNDAAGQHELMDDIIDRIHFIRDQTRLLSFTIDAATRYAERDFPFMLAWARARMWEQYAGNLAGVCIAFDRDGATNHILGHLKHLGSVCSAEVMYTPRGFRDTDASTLLLDQFREGDISDRVGAFVVEHEHDLFFTKTLDWESEHEFRITLIADVGADDEYVYVPFGDAKSVRGVILGEQFPEWQVPAAADVCEQVGVDLLQRSGWRVCPGRCHRSSAGGRRASRRTLPSSIG
jgi:hypothetical protein